MDLFTDYVAKKIQHEQERVDLEREKKMQQAMIEIKKNSARTPF